MLRQVLFFIVASLIAVIFMPQIAHLLRYLHGLHNYLSHALNKVFAGGYFGSVIRNTTSFVLIPLVTTAIPAAIYWVVQRKTMPYLYHVAWVIWLTLVVIVIS